MIKMMATYERGKLLNVRREPSSTAEVVRTMAPGESAPVEEVRDGWAKLADGYAKASLLVIALADAEATEEAAQATEEAPAPDPTPASEPEPEAEADDSELRKMTNPQLYDLAAQSGIKVKKGATKAELIDAILNA